MAKPLLETVVIKIEKLKLEHSLCLNKRKNRIYLKRFASPVGDPFHGVKNGRKSGRRSNIVVTSVVKIEQL